MSARAEGTRGRGRAARAMSALVLMLGLALIAHRAPAATAGAAQRVVVVRALDDDGPAHQVTTLLAAELKAAGFEMVEIDPDPRGGADVEVVAAAWARLQPVATLVIVAPLAPRAGTGTDVTANAGPAIDLWIEDPAIGRRSARRDPGHRRGERGRRRSRAQGGRDPAWDPGRGHHRPRRGAA